MEAGRREELRRVIIQLASPQCGTPDEDVMPKLEQIQDLPRLRALAVAATKAQTWAGLLDKD